jgi:hypothetical protein
LGLADRTIGEAEAMLVVAGISEPRPVLLHRVWSGALRIDLACALTRNTKLEVHP